MARAMVEEYSALVKIDTCSLVPRVPNTKVVDACYVVYMLKRDKTSAITNYKARFLVKGFRRPTLIFVRLSVLSSNQKLSGLFSILP